MTMQHLISIDIIYQFAIEIKIEKKNTPIVTNNVADFNRFIYNSMIIIAIIKLS